MIGVTKFFKDSEPFLHAEFGTGDIDIISTVAGDNGIVYLVLRTRDKPGEIGAIEDPGYLELKDTKPEILLSFSKVESIDGVLADFATSFTKYLGLSDRGNASWYMSYKARDPKVWAKLVKDKKFWLGLKPLIDPDSLNFEPVAYVTARAIPVEWTQEWLEKNGFPCNQVVVVPANGGKHEPKIDAMKKLKIDIFIDDHFKNVVELNQAGIKCFLQDSYHNRRWNVGGLRIKHPNEAIGFNHEK